MGSNIALPAYSATVSNPDCSPAKSSRSSSTALYNLPSAALSS